MSERPGAYEFGGDLPLSGIEPGQSVLVAGSATSGARELALALLLSGADDEGAVVVSADLAGGTLLNECAELAPASASRLRVVDCSGEPGTGGDDRITVAQAGDLTGTGMAVSSILEEFYRTDVTNTRVGIDSVTGLLRAAEFRPVSRFVHTLAGRIGTIDGLGVFSLDTTARSETAVDALARQVDGRIDVRERDGDRELRVEGLPDQPEGWTPFSIELQWPRRVGDHLIDRRVTMGESVSTRYDCLRCDLSMTGDLDAESVANSRCE